MKDFWVLLLLSIFPFSNSPETGTLLIQLDNIEAAKGSIRIAVYQDAQDFNEQEKPLLGKVYPVEASGSISVSFPDISFGTYAIAIFHDVNNNQVLDKNVLGIPKEPYAFSNNPKVKWKAPTFQASQFQFKTEQQQLNITLKKWKAQ